MMAQGRTSSYARLQQQDPTWWGIPGWECLPGSKNWDQDLSTEQLGRLAHLARQAVGRIGAQLSPYLDESLVMGRALMALVESRPAALVASRSREGRAVRRVVEDLRAWIRGGAWFQTAWPRRVEPLCRAAARYGINCPELLADHFGLDESQLHNGFVEAGLVFGVCPERLLPSSELTARGHALLTEVVDELPEQQRTLLTLYFREGLGFDEIAELLQMPGRDLQATYGRAAVHIRSALYGI